MKLSTLRTNFKFPRGFCFCRSTHKIYLPFERVASKFAFPIFEYEYETPWSVNDFVDSIDMQMKWDQIGDVEVYPIMLTRCPYERFISAFEVMILNDRLWPEELFNFKIRRLYDLESYYTLDHYDDKGILECFKLFTKLYCKDNLDYSFLNPITENFKDLSILNDIEIIDVYDWSNTLENRTIRKEKITNISKQEYFADPVVKRIFDRRFSNDLTLFGYSL